MGHDRPHMTVQSKPDKPFGELVQSEKAGDGGKQQLSPVLYFGQRRHSNRTKHSTADKIGAS
jgi:hypothetical protein